MKRKFTFLLMALLALAGFKSWGQTEILSEGFEHDGSFPEGWTATHNNANGTGWYLAGTENSIGSGYSGWSAFCKGASYSGPEDYLTTYAIDFSGYMSASLSFYYINRDWSGDKNHIRVEYSSSTDGSWTTLWSNTTGTGGYNSWTAANNIDISALCGGTYYIRFVDVDKWGYGIAIDDILITGIAGGTSYNITYDNTIQHGSISGPATAFANQTVTLTATPAENYALDHFTVDGLAIQGKTFTMPEHDVTVSATFKQVFTLTVNDGTNFAEGGHRVPFRAEHASNYYTKSEFIIPLGDLEAMRGGTISSLTFYTSNYTNDYDFPNASWDVYVMEADYTLPGGPLSQDGTKFTDVASMTKVYSGPMSVKNHQMTIVLDAPIVYNSKNLIISFQQTSKSNSYVNAQWYGKNEGSAYRSRGGSYNDSNFTSAVDVASKPFLPKTTFTYMPGATYTVNLTQPEAGGTIDATPKTDVTAGATVTLSATPATGYELGEWIVTNVTTSQPITVTNNQFTMPDSDVTVSATFAQLTQHNVNISQSIEHGTVTASPSECYSGTTVTLTAAPDPGYQYTYGNISVVDANGQSVIVNQGNPTSTFTMPNSDVTVSATFTKLYSVSMGTVQNGSAYSAQGSGVAGSTINVFVTPNTGCEVISVIANYEGGSITASFDDVYSGQYLYYFDMPAADVTVNVVCALTYTVSYTQPTGGTISVSPTTHVPASQSVSISIDHIQAHYSFDYANYASKISVKDANENPVTVNQEDDTHYNFSMPASNVTVSVTFDQDANYDIAVTQPEGCTIEVSPSENVYADEPVYLYYSDVESGYQFVEWVVKDGESTIELYNYYGTYYFIMPASENVTVTANVQALTAYTVNIASGITGGSISAYTGNDHEAPITAYAGETVYLTKTPEPGYQFVSFTVTSECGTVEVYNDFYFNMPDCDVTVSAAFVKPETLTVFGNGGPYDNNSVYPVYTYWGDTYGTTSQFIIPAEELEDMVGGTIKGMKFFIYSGGQTGNQIWECRIKEVDDKALTGIVDVSTLTPVYSGHYLSFANNEWNVTFDTPFAYSGKNLLVSFQCTTEGSYKSNSFHGENVDYYASWSSREGGSTFIPKTEFTYLPDPTVVFYDIEIAQVEGGTITASKTKAKADAEIELSVNMDEGYTFSRWIVKDADNQDVTVTDNFFTMPASNVTVTAEYNALPRYNVTLVQSAGGSITATPCENVLEGTWVKLVATPDHGYRFVSWSGSTEAGGTLYIANTETAGFTMRASNATVTATFEALPTYEVNYYANGTLVNTLNPYEGDDIDITPCEVPEGVNFYGWATSEIDETPYLTAAPSIITEGTPVDAAKNLYAVFSYSEQIPATGKDGETWVEVTSPTDLSNGDQVIFVEKNYNKVLAARTGEYDGCFRSANISISNNEISSIPSNAVVFEAESTSGSWKFWFDDVQHPGLTTLTDYNGSYLVPMSMNWGGSDLWTIISNGSSVNIQGESGNYIIYNSGDFTVDGSSVYKKSVLFKKYNPFITNTYYMTSVLTDGEVAANTTAKNIIITTGTVTVGEGVVLTMNENGLFRNKDAANFVFGYGAQLITDNAGVLATMKKHINGIEWYTISSPLAAENTAFADVTNLIPGNNIAAKTYDLYRLNEAEGIWENARPETDQEPAFTTIDKGRGYIYANNAGADHIAFAGEINVADVECNLTNGAAHGFNLIGNPFMQNIKLTDVKSDGTAVLADGFYVLNNDNTWATEPITTGTIAPLQGFLVQATTAGDVTISKPTSSSKGERSNEQNTNIEMIVSNASFKDNAFAMFGEGTGLDKVNHRNAEAPMLYVPQDGEDFAIAFMNENTTIFPVSFKAMTTGSYSISLKATDDVSTLVLVDNMTGEETNMLLEESYKFIGSPADNENRFTVKLKISNNDGQSDSEHFVYQNGSELVVNGEGTLQIFDILGRVVVSEEVHGQTVNVSGLNTGAYIVRLTGESVKTQKIVVR